MSQNLAGQNLRGRSFRDRDLSGVDFSHADIRGADFTNTTLSGAQFNGVQAGIQRGWATGLVFISITLVFLAEMIWVDIPVKSLAWMVGPISGTIAIVLYLVLLAIFTGITIRRGLLHGLMTTVVVGVIAIGLVALAVSAFPTLRQGMSIEPIAGLAGISGVVAAGILCTATLLLAFSLATGIAIAGQPTSFGAVIVGLVGLLAINTGLAGSVVMSKILPEHLNAVKLVMEQFLVAEIDQFEAWNRFLAMAGSDIERDIKLEILTVGIPACGLGIYWGWRTLVGDEQVAPIRKLAMLIAIPGGTSFRRANLTGASFEQATLSNANFRKACLINTNWYQVKKLEWSHIDKTSYLSNLSIRQLVITRKGQGKNFDRQDLRQLNLQKVDLEKVSLESANLANVQLSQANLTGANLRDSNCYQADLRQADLSAADLTAADLGQANLSGANLNNAILTRTKLHLANLSRACLTGACIENWGISSTTEIRNIICQYVYQSWEDGVKNDIVPSHGEFQQGEFATFISSYFNSVGVHHDQDLNPKAAIHTLQNLAAYYRQPIEIVGAAKTKKGISLKLQANSCCDATRIQQEYQSQYANNLNLFWGEATPVSPEHETLERQLIRLIDSVKRVRKPVYIKYLYNNSIFVVAGEISSQLYRLDRLQLQQLLTQFENLMLGNAALLANERTSVSEQLNSLEGLGQRVQNLETRRRAKGAIRTLRGTLSDFSHLTTLYAQGNQILDRVAQLFGL